MVATKSPKSSFNNLLAHLEQERPDITFKPGRSFSWSPKSMTITYRNDSSEASLWSLIHEFAHAELDHRTYATDFELLTLEVAAWEACKHRAEKLGITIDSDHVEDCLDTYRDWLHRRSTCPTCGNTGLQKTDIEYHCHNCYTFWQVSAARFCRPYRRKLTKATASKPVHSSVGSRSTFH
jgi:hypothetical protein